MKEILPGMNSNLEQLLPFSDVDLIVTDIDGTVIAGTESIRTQILSKIKQLRKKGVQITVATGRTFDGVKKLLSELDINRGMPIVLYNGGIVIEYGTENVLYTSSLNVEGIYSILDAIPLDKVNVFMYAFEMVSKSLRAEGEIVNPINEAVYGIGREKKMRDVNGMKIEWIDSVGKIVSPLNAILIEKKHMPIDNNNLIKRILDTKENLTYTDSGSGFIEIKPNGLGKGIIFDILKQQKTYPINKTLAIGDNDNDIELFQYADISVAVANASNYAIEEAEYICENESARGFLDTLEVIELAKKYFND